MHGFAAKAMDSRLAHNSTPRTPESPQFALKQRVNSAAHRYKVTLTINITSSILLAMAQHSGCMSPMQAMEQIREYLYDSSDDGLVESIKSLGVQPAKQKINSNSHQDPPYLMDGVKDMLGMLLFRHSLRNTRVEWNAKLDRTKIVGQFSLTVGPSFGLIEIHPNPYSQPALRGPSPTPGDDIFDTLLHECIHAHIEATACNGKGDCKSTQCRQKWIIEYGAQGHGPAF